MIFQPRQHHNGHPHGFFANFFLLALVAGFVYALIYLFTH